jgi:ABC-type transport system involved in multi-copper enzyme maturation permease subunit
MIGRILAVAANTRKEAYRNRAFLVLVLLGLFLNGAGLLLSKLAVRNQATKVIQDFGYFSVAIVCAMTAIMLGIILLHKELDKKTIYTIVSKPIARFEIVLGKFWGLLTLLVLLVIGLGIPWIATLWYHDALHVGGAAIWDDCLMGMVLMIGEAMIVLGVALLFSSWTRPFLAGVFTFGYFVMGRNMYLLREYLDAAKGPLAEPGPLRNIANGFTYIVPDLDVFNVSGEIALGIDVHGGYVLASTGYAVAFTAVFLALAALFFSRRDLG